MANSPSLAKPKSAAVARLKLIDIKPIEELNSLCIGPFRESSAHFEPLDELQSLAPVAG